MKKLMIALGAVVLAATVNAASVMWGGAFSTPDDVDTTLPAGTQFALLYSSSEFTGVATSVAGFDVGADADNGGSIVSTWAITDEQSNNYEFMAVWNNTGKDVNGYYAILTLNDAGDKAAYMYMGSIEGTTAISAQQDMLYNAGWADPSKTLTSGGYTVAVPEPTSAMLMLLGFAGLALRRRRA